MESPTSILARRITLPALALLLATAVPVDAEWDRSQDPGYSQTDLEVVAGLYVSDLDLDEEPAFGLRLALNPDARWSAEAQVLRLKSDREMEFGVIAIAPPPPGAFTNLRFDYEAIVLDLSARLRLLPEDSPIRLHLLFGPGWGFVDGEVRLRRSNGSEDRITRGGFLDDSFTVHGGLALSFDLAERWYLRFDARARYWDERSADETDQEYTVGLGFRL